MAYLIAVVVVTVLILVIMSLRHRLNSNPVKSVDSFHRAIQALKPERKARDRAR